MIAVNASGFPWHSDSFCLTYFDTLLLDVFLLRAVFLKKNKISGIFQDFFFSDSHYENPVMIELPVVKLTKGWKLPYELSPPGVFNLHICLPPVIHQYNLDSSVKY